MNVASQFACGREVVPAGREINGRKDNLILRILKILFIYEALPKRSTQKNLPKPTN